jgi:hypothetical protein
MNAICFIIKILVIGSMIKVTEKTKNLYSVQFYDNRNRSIQTQSENYTGGIDTITTQYIFSGNT